MSNRFVVRLENLIAFAQQQFTLYNDVLDFRASLAYRQALDIFNEEMQTDDKELMTIGSKLVRAQGARDWEAMDHAIDELITHVIFGGDRHNVK